WFKEFNDEQKNLVLKNFINECEQSQFHLLSMVMSHRMHQGCPANCQDPLTVLPEIVSSKILSYLDAGSLCKSSLVNKKWHQLTNGQHLWRKLCRDSRWNFQWDDVNFSKECKSSAFDWKKLYIEKYRLQLNWLKGRCNVRTFEGHSQGVSCLQFDDTRIVSGSSDNTIKVWNIRTNSSWAVQTLVGHSGKVRCLHLDHSRLVSGSADLTIKVVWDLSLKKNWASIACKVTMIGHTDTVRCLKADDTKVISGSYDKTIKIWNIKNGACENTLRGHEGAVLCIYFDQDRIISGSSDSTIKVWSTSTMTCIQSLTGHLDAVSCLQFVNNKIVSGSLDCTLRYWDLRSASCVKVIDWMASEGHTRVIRLCLQVDKSRVVSASDDKTIKVWSLETGKRLVTLKNHTDGVTCLQFNEDMIVSGSYDKTVKLLDFSCC
ncbi:hypothetical protein HELRODRAFT_62703, partial [Helobdella robusta]|uniref:F-box domain-containing protein n=1 Tax=Helobdella robusta TaxID=6412 RepID=T1FX39_HELRO